MMKKKNVLIIVAVLVAAVLLVALYFVFFGNKRVELSLEDFKHNGQYQYDGIAWGSSVEQVKEALSDSLEEDAARKPPASSGYTFYKTKNEYRLDGMSTNASVQFHDGTLETFQFSFRFEQDYQVWQVWFDNQVAELTSLYGEPTKKSENASDMFESTLYDWSTDNSTLQIVLVTGKNVQPTGVISVGMKRTDGSGA